MHDLVDGLHIDQAHKVKPEAVDVVFLCPVVYGIDDVFAHHAPLGGGVVAAAGAVGEAAVSIHAAEITGNDLVEAEIHGLVHVVVDHVHNNAYAIVMEGFHHLLHFLDTDCAVIGVCGIGALRHVIVHRVVAPVELGTAAAFIGEAEIVNRQQVQMGDAQCFHVVKAGGIAVLGLGAGMGQT